MRWLGFGFWVVAVLITTAAGAQATTVTWSYDGPLAVTVAMAFVNAVGDMLVFAKRSLLSAVAED